MSRITAETLERAAVQPHPVRVARALRGLTQRELERIAGLPATTLSHVEHRRRRLSPASAVRVATVLDADVDALRLIEADRTRYERKGSR